MQYLNDPKNCDHVNVKHFKNCDPPRIWCQDCGKRVDEEALAAEAAAAGVASIVEPPSQSIEDALKELEADVKGGEGAEESGGVLARIGARMSGKKKKSEK